MWDPILPQLDPCKSFCVSQLHYEWPRTSGIVTKIDCLTCFPLSLILKGSKSCKTKSSKGPRMGQNKSHSASNSRISETYSIRDILLAARAWPFQVHSSCALKVLWDPDWWSSFSTWSITFIIMKGKGVCRTMYWLLNFLLKSGGCHFHLHFSNWSRTNPNRKQQGRDLSVTNNVLIRFKAAILNVFPASLPIPRGTY